MRFLCGAVVLLTLFSIGAVSGCAEDAKKPKTITNSIGMKLAMIPVGEFMMGSPKDEQARSPVEQQHRVQITRPFYLGIYTVTQSQYEKVMGKNPSHFSSKGGGRFIVDGQDTSQFPVETVSWDDANEFCKRLSQKERKKYRLPTEAEWEYACRAGTTTTFNLGNSLSSTQANFDGRTPYGGAEKGKFLARPTNVGSYQPNAFGLYDMHGNVWQWCSDWHARDYYANSPAQDPPGPPSGSAYVIRGGGWFTEGESCRSASRHLAPQAWGSEIVGFRVVQEP